MQKCDICSGEDIIRVGFSTQCRRGYGGVVTLCSIILRGIWDLTPQTHHLHSKFSM